MGGGGPGMRGGAVAGLPALHKTDSAFKPGQTHTEDPEEEEKQKKFKVWGTVNFSENPRGCLSWEDRLGVETWQAMELLLSGTWPC
jgi:hypothetical protein